VKLRPERCCEESAEESRKDPMNRLADELLVPAHLELRKTRR
jgi:hypothetical protein